MPHEDFCPACQKTLPFDECDGDLFCSECGRTKGAAEQAVKASAAARKRANVAKWLKRAKYAFYAVGAVGFIPLFNVRSRRHPGQTIGSSALGAAMLFGVIALLALGIPFLIRLFSKRKASRSSDE